MNKVFIGGNHQYHLITRDKWIDSYAACDLEDDFKLPRSIMRCPRFYIQHAKYILNNDSSYLSLTLALQCMTDTLAGDKNFASQLVRLFPSSLWYFSNNVKKDVEVIKSFIHGCFVPGYYNQSSGMMRNYLGVENRITVAYEVCKLYPQYEQRFGAALRRKLNGQDIVKYVETQNLFKKLNKEVPKRVEVTKRKKI